MRRAAVGAATALFISVALTGCNGKSISQNVCEAYGGNWNDDRVPACAGRNWNPTAYERETCVMVVMAGNGVGRGDAEWHCS